MAKPAPPKSAWKQVEPFVIGGSSGMIATSIIQPIDMIKVRIQLLGEGSKTATASKNPITIALNVVRQEGFVSLYAGLSAALLRQATYTTARLGLFQSLTDYLKSQGNRKSLTFAESTGAGLVAGGLGAVIGTPADVALIRMQADGTLPPEQRRNYKGVGNALSRIVKEEGVAGIFKGTLPVVTRAMALNVGMLSGNDQVTKILKEAGWAPVPTTIAAKTVAGFFASAFSLPFDFVKTRIQKQKPLPDGTLPYRSSIHCVQRVIAEEGLLKFYTGFATYYVRIAPHAMITLFAADALKALLN